MTQPGKSQTRLKYRPSLDGLRGVAVLAVMFYHAERFGFAGGYLGVHLFFVLSGFLITSLIVREKDQTGGINLAGFWARRARRLLPAVLIMLTVVTVVWPTCQGRSTRGDASVRSSTLPTGGSSL